MEWRRFITYLWNDPRTYMLEKLTYPNPDSRTLRTDPDCHQNLSGWWLDSSPPSKKRCQYFNEIYR